MAECLNENIVSARGLRAWRRSTTPRAASTYKRVRSRSDAGLGLDKKISMSEQQLTDLPGLLIPLSDLPLMSGTTVALDGQATLENGDNIERRSARTRPETSHNPVG